MKTSKGMMILILFTAAAMLLTGCGQGEAKPGNSQSEKLQVGLVLDPVGLGDGGFNDAANNGLAKAGKDFGSAVETTAVVLKDLPSGEKELRRLAENKTDLVIAMGYYFTEMLPKVAGEYPETKFVLIDNNLPNLKSGGNLTCVTFKDHEGAFLAGAAAALKSRTGKIGFVGGAEIPAVKNFETGYAAGARYINPKIEVFSNYVASGTEGFNDPEKGRVLAMDQIKSGADVIFQAAGASGLGVLEAATAQKILVIGADTDQSYAVPEPQRGYVLTSILKGVDTAVYDVIKLRLDNKLAGGYVVLGIKDSVETYAENDINRDLLAGIKPRLDEIKEKIVGGEIKVPVYE
ncbi:BMP family lipoprotein [Candidatus Formimonas warabiya]|nr:BMP family ABC transporter substrate-binding protein [Candidatus Formimonas warabiya]